MRAEDEQFVRFIYVNIRVLIIALILRLGCRIILRSTLSKLLFEIEIYLSIYELRLFDGEN